MMGPLSFLAENEYCFGGNHLKMLTCFHRAKIIELGDWSMLKLVCQKEAPYQPFPLWITSSSGLQLSPSEFFEEF